MGEGISFANNLLTPINDKKKKMEINFMSVLEQVDVLWWCKILYQGRITRPGGKRREKNNGGGGAQTNSEQRRLCRHRSCTKGRTPEATEKITVMERAIQKGRGKKNILPRSEERRMKSCGRARQKVIKKRCAGFER